jgi:hypothetical protein
LGNDTLIAFGLTSVDVIIKNMSNKNTKSVMDAMLKSGFTFVLLLNGI